MWLRALVLATLAGSSAWGEHDRSGSAGRAPSGRGLELGAAEPRQPGPGFSFSLPRCSQDAVAGQVLFELFTNHKQNIPLKYSEDCLYLNIYTPADLAKKSRLPVMVWIHGGGLFLGGASTYDGLALAAHENVVVVTIQYRLGIWGFFSTGDEHSRGNWGHLDQLAALHWVQDNIASFGGNPGSVTIFGESAGGESVSVLVSDPDTSPNPTLDPAWSPSVLRTHLQFQKAVRGKFLSVDLLGDPRERHMLLPTVIDGVVLPKTPEELQAERKFHLVPYMIGINKQEFGWILPTLMGYPLSEGKLDQKTAMSLLWNSYPSVKIPKELIPEATEKYLGGTDDPVKKKDLFLDLVGDVTLDAGAPTYMYEFQYRPSFSSDLKPKTVIGDHGDEIFSCLLYTSRWLPHWPEYNQKEGYLQIGANTQAAQKLKDKEVAFWTNLFAKKVLEKPPQTEHIEL
uniref:Carboxylic ester hydrolase n=1 Tax=Aotus nancymaae TaxID=37293 RepID=A0A2K5DBV8_AOTNA